ncbi:MAG: tetratricopeptide repeat protein [Burkholderiales bacterium]
MPLKTPIVAFALLLLASHAFAQDIGPVLQQAESLLSAGRAAEAYQLLAPHETQQKNDARFDYLLGASLLESNQAAQAIAPLKRALAINPLFAAARLDLGRAHFAVGNFDEAKSALNTAAYQNPPPAARQAIGYYLAEIERGGRATNLSGNAYISATVGRDSNVSGGLKDNQIFFLDQGIEIPFPVNKNNLQASDAYVSYSVGANVRLALDHNLALFANADVQRRDNNTLHIFDSMNGVLNLGLEKNLGQSNFKISGNFGRGVLDYTNLRRNNGGTLEWRYDFSRLEQFTFYSQAGRIRFYPRAYRDYDVNQRLFGISWFSVSDTNGSPSISTGINYGEETAQGALPDGNKRTWGARLGGQISVASNLVAAAGLGYSRDQFDRERLISFDTKPGVIPVTLARSDNKTDFNLGLTWVPELNWTVRPNYTHTRATSNNSIYEFARNDFSLSIRRDFR